MLELITSPAYQRRGIGASLIQYGLEKADKEGVPCYLTASPMGAPLYKKVGFEEVGRVEVELEQFGGEKGVKHVHCEFIPSVLFAFHVISYLSWVFERRGIEANEMQWL